MYDVRKELRDLADRAKELHVKERLISIESVSLVGELERRNAAVNMYMTSEQFAAYVALTPNQYWKRAQAARVIRFFPKALEMVKAGETQESHLALISPKITQANSELLLIGIKNKSKRDVEGLLSRVTADGRLLDKEAEVELRLKLTTSQLAMLDRAREVLSHGGQIPSLSDILIKALGDLLEKRDPLRKAERAAARREKSECPSPGKEDLGLSTSVSDAPTPGKEVERCLQGVSEAPSPGKGARPNRPAIPAAIRHIVWLRDGGQCTWTHPDGSRCTERSMLELDHIEMWCRGGEHNAENLTLRCRRHNQFSANEQLGAEFMAKWQASPRFAAASPEVESMAN